MAWRSMNSAPRDGRDVLLYCPDFKETEIAFYRESEASAQHGRVVWELPKDGGCLAENVPSHWHPMPTPPRIRSRVGGSGT
jgi:hypothetical protein